MRLLQRMGYDVGGLAPMHRRIVAVHHGGDAEDASIALDASFAFLERTAADPTRRRAGVVASGKTAATPADRRHDWPCFHGNPGQTGATSADGPCMGRLAWQAQVGLAWYSRPVAAAGRVYAASPGMRQHLLCLDLATGESIFATPPPLTDHVSIDLHPYGKPCVASTPIVREHDVVLREMGSMGGGGPAKHLLRCDRATGAVLDRVAVGHVDYRQGYPVVVGEDTRLVTVSGEQQIASRPPQLGPAERVDRWSADGRERRWSFHCGPTYGEPALAPAAVVVGTQQGLCWCLNDDGPVERSVYEPAVEGRVRWVRDLGSALNQTPRVDGEGVVVTDQSGRVHALDLRTGETRWTTRLTEPEPRAFKLFSNVVAAAGRLYLGSAAGGVYCLDAADGRCVWERSMNDWVRAAPALTSGGDVVVVDIDGEAAAFSADDGERRWSRRVTEAPVLADVVAQDGVVLVADAALSLHALDEGDGHERWRRRLIPEVERDGRTYDADTLGGGGFFQSSPTISGPTVYVGTPSRFVVAHDLDTGRRRWRCEVGGAVSSAPLIHDGRVCFGQQGGDHAFMCVDALSGLPRWTQTLGWVWSSPQVAGTTLVVPGVDGHVYGLVPDTGSIRWRTRTGAAVHPMPACDERRVIVGSWDGLYYALSPDDGRILYVLPTGGRPDSGAAALHGGRVYLSMMSRRVHIHDAESARPLGTIEAPSVGGNVNVTPALDDHRLILSYAEQPATTAIEAWVLCFDPRKPEPRWRWPGGGLNAAAIAGDVCYFASSAAPFISAVRDIGHAGELLWRFDTGQFAEEASVAVVDGSLAALSADGVLRVIR
jgi:outer membrane protein assembly factor BamB